MAAPAPRMLGLLGGMGPNATADVLNKIILNTPATRDQEHIPILVRCVPQIPDRTEALLHGGPSPEPALVEGVQLLAKAGVEIIAMTCNTAHHWYEAVCDVSQARVLHIADAVVAELGGRLGGRGPIGLMATDGTLASGFYQRKLAAAGYDVLLLEPTMQARCAMSAIAAAKAGDMDYARRCAEQGAQALFEAGAKFIILGCTELPLALADGREGGERFIDPNLALARACIRAAFARAL